MPKVCIDLLHVLDPLQRVRYGGMFSSAEVLSNGSVGAEPGCTELEMVSSNVERFLMAEEIIGQAAVHDPFEMFAELVAMFDGDPSNDLTADRSSGPDGIVFNDFDFNGDGVIAHDSLEIDQTTPAPA